MHNGPYPNLCQLGLVCCWLTHLPTAGTQGDQVCTFLPEATIIVTSRPSVSADLWSLCQHNIDRHLEVIGFTKEDIKRFAESVFSGDILTGFLSYITSNPPIYGMMYIPLNAVIVALIYKDSYDTDTPFPTTMTQLFDALIRALIRRHLVSTHQVSNNYCMPPSLQCTEDISKLPPLVVQQLLELARVAYKSLHGKKRYVFTDLGVDFEHLGMMKKTTSLNVCTGPGCSYSFLHLTLEEYLTALHIAIVHPNGFELVALLKGCGIVVRFLAGMCRLGHPVYQQLVNELASNKLSPADTGLDMVHCAYECPSIADSVKVDYSVCESIQVEPVTGFDWYATGYCIGHFDERWQLDMREYNVNDEGIDLLLKGLRSSSNATRKIRYLFLQALSLSKTFGALNEFIELLSLELFYISLDNDDEVVLQQLISPESGLRKLIYVPVLQTHSRKLIPLVFQQSSLDELTLDVRVDNMITELLPLSNTNLKKLVISRNLLHSLAALIPNITSLTYLQILDPLTNDLLVLTNIVQSHHTLEVLFIGEVTHCSASNDTSTSNIIQLIEATGNNQLKELRLIKSDYDSS